MPYIKQEDRLLYDDYLIQLADMIMAEHASKFFNSSLVCYDVSCAVDKRTQNDKQATPGQLNYIITKLINLSYPGTLKYFDYNEIIGILTNIKVHKGYLDIGLPPSKPDRLAAIIGSILRLTYGNPLPNNFDLDGMLECCKLEFYRRRTALYEDLKILDNGDV